MTEFRERSCVRSCLNTKLLCETVTNVPPMIGFKSYNRCNRIAVLAIALLLSNIVGQSEHMA